MNCYTEKQIKEASLLIFLIENSFESVDDVFYNFVEQFKSDREPELVFADTANDFRLKDCCAPWMLYLRNGNTILHYENVYISEFIEDGRTVFKNEEMMRKDKNFSDILTRFYNIC